MLAIPIFQIIVVLLILALAWWIFRDYVLPNVPQPFRTIIIVLLALLVIFWLLGLAGLVGPTPIVWRR